MRGISTVQMLQRISANNFSLSSSFRSKHMETIRQFSVGLRRARVNQFMSYST